MPSPGLIRGLRPAAGPGVRDDGGVSAGYTVPVFYDSMIAKLIAWAPSRDEAIARMARALREYQVLGIRTTIPFFLWLMHQPEYIAGRLRHDLPGSTARGSGTVRRTVRRAPSFNEISAHDEEVVAIGAALDAYMRASAASGRGASRRRPRGDGLEAARREALRG